MKKIGLGSMAVAIALTGTATAADVGIARKVPPLVAPQPGYSWTGLYIGGHVGGGWGTKESTFIPTLVGFNFFLPTAGGTTNLNGFLGGGQIGVNYQTGWVVIGIEADASWSGIKGTSSCFNFVNCKVEAEWFTTLTGRIGGALDRALLYVKGGVAWVEDTYHFTNIFPSVFSFPDVSDKRTGWVFGAGVEFAFTRNWSGKIEYNYMDFGTKRISFVEVPPPAVFDFDIRQNLHVVKAGLNYKLDWVGPVTARY